MSVTEADLTAETGITIFKKITEELHIINPTSHHNELPLYRRKENNSSINKYCSKHIFLITVWTDPEMHFYNIINSCPSSLCCLMVNTREIFTKI